MTIASNISVKVKRAVHKLRIYSPVKSIVPKAAPEGFLRFPDTGVVQIKNSNRAVGYSTCSSHSIQSSVANFEGLNKGYEQKFTNIVWNEEQPFLTRSCELV